MDFFLLVKDFNAGLLFYQQIQFENPFKNNNDSVMVTGPDL